MARRTSLDGTFSRLDFGLKSVLSPVLLVALLPGAGLADPVRLEPVVENLVRPVDVGHAGDGSGRLFIALQTGEVLVYDGSRLLDEPFLDISGRVSCCSGQGILGMAFHPDYRRTGHLFVAYTNRRGDAVVGRFTVSDDPNRADRSSGVEILEIEQPYPGHNNGDVAFGADGYLYVATGDGGGSGDPDDQAQNLESLLGKILRLDVDSALPYAIPADNPFVGVLGAREEIWAYGLRYPWRFSVDRLAGDLYISDVGESQREEVNVQRAASAGGENYGWRRMEGSACFEPPTDCQDDSLVVPEIEYDHAVGCSVIGGYRYRGPAVPTLPRFYVYGDFCAGRVWGARPDSAGLWRSVTLGGGALSMVSFGEDEAGNVYLVHYTRGEPDGVVYRLVGEPLFASGFEAGGLNTWSRARGAVALVEPGLKRSARALEVTTDGTARRSFVAADIGWAQAIFSVRFVLDPRAIDLDDSSLEILRVVGPRHHASLVLAQDGAKYFVELWARDGAGGLTLHGRTRVPAARAVRLELEWFRATSAESDDGEVRLAKNGRVKVAATDLANGAFSIDSVQVGLPGGSEGVPAGGRLRLDEFVATP